VKKKTVLIMAEFEVGGGYTEPRGYAEAMLEQAKGYIATQCKASRNEYRGQVWSFVRDLVGAAKVRVWLPATRKNCQKIIDRNKAKAEVERLKSSKVEGVERRTGPVEIFLAALGRAAGEIPRRTEGEIPRRTSE